MIQWEQENLNMKVILKFFEKITVGGKAYAPVGSVFTDRRT